MSRRHPRARSRKPKLDVAELLRCGTDEHYRDIDLYDFEYADRTEDIEWYRGLASTESGSDSRPQVLELGAGTGRITVPLARDGYFVYALDRMPDMLAGLERRVQDEQLGAAIEPMRADMRTIPLPDESVDLAIAPFNTLMHLYTWRDLLSCFREVRRVLRPNGRFAFDVQVPDLEWLLWKPNKRYAITRFTHPRTGERLIYSTNHRYDAATQICHIRIYYDDAPKPGQRFVPPPEPRELVHLAHRQLYPEELRLLVGVSDFELEHHTADFSDAPLRGECESQCIVARKPV